MLTRTLAGGERIVLDAEKNTEVVKVRTSTPLLLELMRLAAADERSLSDYCRTVLAAHVWGHGRRGGDDASVDRIIPPGSGPDGAGCGRD